MSNCRHSPLTPAHSAPVTPAFPATHQRCHPCYGGPHSGNEPLPRTAQPVPDLPRPQQPPSSTGQNVSSSGGLGCPPSLPHVLAPPPRHPALPCRSSAGQGHAHCSPVLLIAGRLVETQGSFAERMKSTHFFNNPSAPSPRPTLDCKPTALGPAPEGRGALSQS